MVFRMITHFKKFVKPSVPLRMVHKRTTSIILLRAFSKITASAQTVTDIDVWYPVYPVLQRKTHNPVARINLPASADGQFSE